MVFRLKVSSFVCFAILLASFQVNAYVSDASVVDLTGAGSNGGGFGNSLSFTTVDEINFTVTAYAETGLSLQNSSSIDTGFKSNRTGRQAGFKNRVSQKKSSARNRFSSRSRSPLRLSSRLKSDHASYYSSYYYGGNTKSNESIPTPVFETAEVFSFAQGLGICNRNEGVIGGGCSAGEHEIDTSGANELLVFEFEERVSFESLTVDPFQNTPSIFSHLFGEDNDRDIRFLIGDELPDLSTIGFDELGDFFSIDSESYASQGFSSLTHDLLGATGRFLLISGIDSGFSPDDAYKITSIGVSSITASEVPLPAAFWLMLGALAPLARRKSS